MTTTHRNDLFWRLGLIFVAGVLPVSACLENAARGPYTTWFELLDPTARTFDYDPLPFWPFGKVQVFCTHGVVTGLEMFDD